MINMKRRDSRLCHICWSRLAVAVRRHSAADRQQTTSYDWPPCHQSTENNTQQPITKPDRFVFTCGQFSDFVQSSAHRHVHTATTSAHIINSYIHVNRRPQGSWLRLTDQNFDQSELRQKVRCALKNIVLLWKTLTKNNKLSRILFTLSSDACQ